MTPARATALYGVAALVTVLATILAATGVVLVGHLALLIAPLVLALVVRGRYLDGGVSPLLVVACGLVATAGFGAAFGRSVGDHGGVSVQLALSDEDTWRTVLLLCWSATALLIGGAFALAVARRRTDRTGTSLPLSSVPLSSPALAASAAHLADRALDWARTAREGLRAPDSSARSLLLAASGTPLLALIAVDGTDLLQRNTYLIGDAGSVDGSIAKLGLVGVVGCGLVLGLEHGARRAPAFVVAAGYFAVFFAMASRSVAMVPVLVAVGVHVARPRRASAVALGLSVVVALLLLPVPLFLRGTGTHGLLPYLTALPGILSSDDILSSTADNLLITFPLVGTTAFDVVHLPTSLFWMQMNPLPGSVVGWYDVSDALRINADTPFSGAGELRNYGWGVLTGFWLVVGAFLGALEREIAACLALGRRGVALVLTALPLVFLVLVLQYNLRSAVRLLVYTAVITLAVRAWRALRDHGERLAQPALA